MKIAILGGTGSIGEGLAMRWSQKHDIIIGSRKCEKAEDSANKYCTILEECDLTGNISGCINADAVKQADVVVLSIRYEHAISTIESVKPYLKDGHILISIVVPMTRDGYFKYTPPMEGSAAMEFKKVLPEGVKLVSAFHNVSAKKLSDIEEKLKMDVFICGDDEEANQIVSDLVWDIPDLRPLIAGPLEVSSMVESLTPLLVNLAMYNKKKHLGIQCV
ncbi:MAG: NADPH-dependent F420 reductase [ANME-2 cluster archaeon]|nr:NADPH-dependent F420 reductase [ANME-2 cluster archaeon]